MNSKVGLAPVLSLEIPHSELRTVSNVSWWAAPWPRTSSNNHIDRLEGSDSIEASVNNDTGRRMVVKWLGRQQLYGISLEWGLIFESTNGGRPRQQLLVLNPESRHLPSPKQLLVFPRANTIDVIYPLRFPLRGDLMRLPQLDVSPEDCAVLERRARSKTASQRYSSDEESGIQARPRKNPTKPGIPDTSTRQEFEYVRQGIYDSRPLQAA